MRLYLAAFLTLSMHGRGRRLPRHSAFVRERIEVYEMIMLAAYREYIRSSAANLYRQALMLC